MQQQEQQNADCSALQYAHSKKQRELIKAKEYSENIKTASVQELQPKTKDTQNDSQLQVLYNNSNAEQLE